jgi:hypothetical protein
MVQALGGERNIMGTGRGKWIALSFLKRRVLNMSPSSGVPGPLIAETMEMDIL